MTDTLDDKPLSKRPTSGRTPGGIVWAIVLVAVAALVFLQVMDPVGDAAALNVLTLIVGFVAVITPLVWFVFFSDYPRKARIATVVVIALPIAAFLAFYQIDRVSGTLIPQFRSRFTPPADATLEKPRVEPAAAGVDLTVESPSDFPQFLGSQRNAVVADVYLERDWAKSPPKLLWKQPIGAGWSAFSVRNGFAVTLEQRGDDELITCYEVATGKLRWSHAESGRHETVLGGVGPRSTPTIHGGNVYVVTALGLLICLDGAHGQPKWKVDLIERFESTRAEEASEIAWGRSSSPLIVDNTVVVPAGGPSDKPVSLAAFDLDSGEIVWQAGTTQISYASPTLATLAGVRQIVSVNESNVTGHDPGSGEVLWTTAWPGDSSANASTSQAQAVGENQLLLSKGYGVGGQLLELATNDDGKFAVEVVWENSRVLKTKFTNAAIVGQYAYDLSDGLLECVDLETGKHTWKGKRYGQGQLLAVGDVLLVMSENTGEVVMVDASPQKHTELGRFQAIEGQTWNNLCLSGKYLLLRNSQEAACFELPLREAPAPPAAPSE